MIFWVLRKEKNDRNTFLVEIHDNKESAYRMADFLNWLNPDNEHWVLEII